MEDRLRVSRSLVIPVSELDVRFSPSGGPGGQHANRAHTRVEIRFDVAGSPSLGPRQRARLVEKLGAEVRVVCDDERSQYRNRTIALERLRGRLEEALQVEAPRRATRPSLGSKRRRLDAKKRRGDVKKGRSGSWD